MATALSVSPADRRKIAHLIDHMRSHDGLAPVDLPRFWNDQDIATRDAFGAGIPQVPLGAILNGECVYDELGIPEDYFRYEHDEPWRLELHRAFNDKAERIVGRRILSETPSNPAHHYPPVKWLHDVFEARNVWHDRSWWLQPSAHTEDELKALLDRVEARDVRRFILPEGWDEAKARLMPLGIRPPLYRFQRGPITFATSVYGVENLIFLIMDSPDLAVRFRDVMLKTMLAIGRVLDEEAGHTPANAPRGFHFNDDNCALLNAEMYELFGYPILKALFDRYSPDPGDYRGQHSDSDMAHLLPILGRLNLHYANFGPTLSVSQIREQLPHAVIHGQLAPFTYSRNEEENMVAEFLRDFAQARERRGLVFSTAGSINNGSRLTGMRLLMSAIQHYGRYDN